MQNRPPLKVQIDLVRTKKGAATEEKPAYYRCTCGQFFTTANGAVNHLFNKHRPFDFIEIRLVEL